jgi:hypothetical protein
MNKNINYYQLLGINIKSTREEIIRAYKKEIFKNHPDRNIGKEEAKLQISILLNEAYEILGDDKKRKEYDETIMKIKIPSGKIGKIEQYLKTMRDKTIKHSANFENYYSDLYFREELEILFVRKIIPVIEKQINIKFNRLIDLDIKTTNDYEWPLFSPSNIYKRKYCLVLNSYDSKLFYILLFDKKDYDLLFKNSETDIWMLCNGFYFDGENIKYADTILDTYIKHIVHYIT